MKQRNRGRRVGRRVLNWWLVRMHSRSVRWHLILIVAIWFALQILTHAIGLSGDSLVVGGTAEAIIVLISVSLPVGLTFLALRSQLSPILDLLDVSPAGVPMMLSVVSEELNDLLRRVRRLRNSRAFDHDEIAEWARRACFSNARGAYKAVDVVCPSTFMSRYEKLLEAQKEYVANCRHRSVRVNVVGMAALRQDALEWPRSFKAYVDWHAANHVALLHCPPEVASEIARRHDLGNEPVDVGFWDGELALRTWLTADGTDVRLAVAGEDLYADLAGYVDELLARARPLWLWP